MHFYHKYLAMPWIAGENDCYHFCLKVWKEQFNIDGLPRYNANDTKPVNARRKMTNIDTKYWQKINNPKEGDAVLMKKAIRVAHIGIWIQIQQDINQNAILHCIEDCGVILTTPNRLCETGYQIDSYYRIVK